ncbi:MAG: PEGA domain-containing protein, partial [candidate division WOR-3 bacterium]
KCKRIFSDKKKYCIYCGVKLVPFEKSKPKETPVIKAEIEVSGDSLIITSIPEGAAVYIDSKYLANTPVMVGVSLGSHTIKLVYPGYKDYIKIISVEDEKTTKIFSVKECPKCGRWFSTDILFSYCPYCEQEEKPVPLQVLTVLEEKIKKCPRCELYFPDSFNFCPFCEEENNPVKLIKIK